MRQSDCPVSNQAVVGKLIRLSKEHPIFQPMQGAEEQALKKLTAQWLRLMAFYGTRSCWKDCLTGII